MTFWLWAFATRQYCYYVIDRRRGAAVVKQVLGTLFPGIFVTGFSGAYHAIQALAKQRCYFHQFTELIKVDKLNASATWKRFRKNFLACSRMRCVWASSVNNIRRQPTPGARQSST